MEFVEDKKIKRAAANVNERRRMQNINSGFEALRDIIDVPNKSKLSKSAILRHSVDMFRNVVSENQQLREQNIFLRNLYTGPLNTSSNNLLFPFQTVQPNLSSTSGLQPNLSPTSSGLQPNQSSTSSCLLHNWSSLNDSMESPAKRVKYLTAATATINSTSALSNISTTTTSTPNKKNTPPITPPIKSPRRYSAHVNKLLASPKRMTRSSVITQNYAYASPSKVQDSPTRKSLRLQHKQEHFGPDSSRNTLNAHFEKPTTPPESPDMKCNLTLLEQRKRELLGFYTPESSKYIPARSAKRSLDAIIQAIDQIERS